MDINLKIKGDNSQKWKHQLFLAKVILPLITNCKRFVKIESVVQDTEHSRR